MKFWKEKESEKLKGFSFWQGEFITELSPNEVFVFGSNPEARHFAGAAKSALKFGAIPRSGKTQGISRGFSPNKQTYCVITKNLTAGITVDGITYDKEGYLSVSSEQIRNHIAELYACAKENPDKKFLITYKYETWPNGTPKKSLNGYTSQEMLELFAKDIDVPPNIVFHESYKPHLEKFYGINNKSSENKNNSNTGSSSTRKTYSKSKTKVNEENKSMNTPSGVVGIPNELKNLYPSIFQYDGKTYACIEHLMVYEKAKTFGDKNAIIIANAISEEPIVIKLLKKEITPSDIEKDRTLYADWRNVIETIKALNQEVKNVNEVLWKEKAPNLMVKSIVEKIKCNEEMKNSLKTYVKFLQENGQEKTGFGDILIKVDSLINSLEIYKNSKQNKKRM